MPQKTPKKKDVEDFYIAVKHNDLDHFDAGNIEASHTVVTSVPCLQRHLPQLYPQASNIHGMSSEVVLSHNLSVFLCVSKFSLQPQRKASNKPIQNGFIQSICHKCIFSRRELIGTFSSIPSGQLQ